MKNQKSTKISKLERVNEKMRMNHQPELTESRLSEFERWNKAYSMEIERIKKRGKITGLMLLGLFITTMIASIIYIILTYLR